MIEKVYVVISSFGAWEDKFTEVSACFVDKDLAEAYVTHTMDEFRLAKMYSRYPDMELLHSNFDEFERLQGIFERVYEYNTSWVVEQDIKYKV